MVFELVETVFVAFLMFLLKFATGCKITQSKEHFKP